MLDGKVVALSGAGSRRGIGFKTSLVMARYGARVAILDIDQEALAQAQEKLGRSHLTVACDVTRPEDCVAAAEQVLERFGQIDVLCNIAGVTAPLDLMEIDSAGWERIVSVNLTGVFNLSQAFVPHMRYQGSGSIICMSSVSAQRGGGIFGGPHYSAAKAGVLGLAKAMARELGPDGIRVNCVTPGLIETDITGSMLKEETREQILAGIPLGRIGKTDDVAGAYVFLASDLSAYITGAVIDVNGGMLIHG